MSAAYDSESGSAAPGQAENESTGTAAQAEVEVLAPAASGPPSAAREQRCDGLRCDGRLEVDPYCTLHGDIGRARYEALVDAERRALAYQEFVAYTLDEFGHVLSSQWKAHARAVLADAE